MNRMKKTQQLAIVIEGQECHRHGNPDGTEGGWVSTSATVAATATIAASAVVLDRAEVHAYARIPDGVTLRGIQCAHGYTKIEGEPRPIG